MRIAMIAGSSYPPIDGIGAYSLNLARQLVALGHRVTIVTRGKIAMSRSETGGVELVHQPVLPLYPFHVHVHGYFVNRYLTEHQSRFDIIHAHSPLVPVPDDVNPVVTTLHSPLAEHELKIDDALSLLTALQLRVSRRLEHRLLLRSRSIAVVNPLLVPSITKAVGHGISVTVLGNGVDTDRFSPDPPARERNLVVSVGRLQYGKGHDDLLTAWPLVLRRHARATLAIVGDGPLHGRLRALADALGILGSVRFIGAILPTESEALLRMYRRAALVVQPSHHEGLSTVLLEAMAVGAPIVATSVGGHATVIETGLDGVLVPPGDPRALSVAISHVLSSVDADEMGVHARTKVVSSYSWARIAEGYEAWYASVLNG